MAPTYSTPEGITPGQQFGALTVLYFAGRDKGYRAKFAVKCSCGSETVVLGSSMKKGNTLRCNVGGHRKVHGMTGTPEFKAWKAMLSRVRGEYQRARIHYVNRGIGIHKPWETSFIEFLAHIGPMPSPGLEIDRIDNERGYEPGNIRWATRSQQMRNTRLTRMLTIHGVCRPEVEWAEMSGLHVSTLRYRVNRKWAESELLSQHKWLHRSGRCA